MLKLLNKLATPLLLMIWATGYFIQVLGQKPASQYLIRPVYIAALVLAILIAFNEYKAWKREMADENQEKVKEKNAAFFRQLRIVLLFSGGTALYLLLLPYGGFVLLTPIFLAAAFRYLRASWIMTAVLALGLTAFVFVVFKLLLAVPLPVGFLGF